MQAAPKPVRGRESEQLLGRTGLACKQAACQRRILARPQLQQGQDAFIKPCEHRKLLKSESVDSAEARRNIVPE